MVCIHYIPNSDSFVTLAKYYFRLKCFLMHICTIFHYIAKGKNGEYTTRKPHTYCMQSVWLFNVKLFRKGPLGTTPFLNVSEMCRYFNFY